ncbi:MAG: TonB-dependent receptor plug [Stygiobacter sp.]|nr:MAG: TonB-dependent receptor plug [Stygiobacter sp.]KAF0217044.1 MAG: TonB-dependent receptor [Ignavibacteria bacterium]
MIPKLKLFLLVTVCLSFFHAGLHAQENGTIRGIVRDSTSQEVLPFSTVMIKELGTGTSTNNRGYFVITSVPANRSYTVIVSYIGFKSKQVTVKVVADKVTDLEIFLIPSKIQLQEIEQVGQFVKAENTPSVSTTTISAKELNSIPKGVETDVLRSLVTLPGVQSTGDVSAKFNVRGGENNQNLIMLDGMPIYYPFHAIGLFSVVDPDVISSVEFFRGGYPSNYGRALSSVLKIVTKEGNKNRFAGNFSASLLSLKGLIEGPIPNGSFYFSGRKSTSNNILKKFVDQNELPVEFYDASLKLNFSHPSFFAGSKFTLQGLFSEDNLNFSKPTDPDYRWSNKILGLKIFSVGTDALTLDFGIVYSQYINSISQKQSTIKPKENEIDDFTISTDFSYTMSSKDEINLGIDLKYLKTKLFLENRFGFRSDVGASGLSSNAYVGYKFLQISDIGIDLGTRFNIASAAAKGDFFEPRINVSYSPIPQLIFKAASGIYQQDITTISDEREVLSLFDPVIIIPEELPKSKAVHHIVGMTLKLTTAFSIETEGYYKNIISAPTYNEEKVLFSDPDLLESKGEAYGGEIQTKYRSNLFDFSTSYSINWAFKEVNGIKYAPRFDSRHNLNLSFTLHLPADFEFSANWVYNSGHPFTKQLGYYQKLSLDNFLDDYRTYQLLFPVRYFDLKNSSVLPDYHRLDLILSKTLNLSFVNLHFDISAINTYNRKNIFYFDQTSGERVNMLPFLLTGTIKAEL